MTAYQLIQYLAWGIYLVIFVVVAIAAVRRPVRVNIDIALFFAATTLIIAFSVVGGLLPLTLKELTGALSSSLLISLAYLLLRLVDDFSDVPAWTMRGAEAFLAVAVVGTFYFAFNPPSPAWFGSLELLYIIALLVYNTVAFVRESRRTSGVTQRRMTAVALGSIFLILDLMSSGMNLFFPNLGGLWSSLADVAGLASGMCYFVGFAPPGILRRAWQEPELRAFLGRAASLPRLPDTTSIVKEMAQGAASALGAQGATVGLWDESRQVLHFDLNGEAVDVAPSPNSAGQAFAIQKPVFVSNFAYQEPEVNALTQRHNIRAVLAAPITAGEKRLGVLSVFAPRAPVFADEDLALVQLMADQAAVILESRALIDEAAQVRAREEVARMKEDFLSAAAHDLKTPLTTLVAHTQLMERRVMRAPDVPVDLPSVQKLVKEASRLRSLVLELLDATRTEQGRLVGELEEVDLVEIASETCARHDSARHHCVVEALGDVKGVYDPSRMEQLIENLVENGVKYSPEGGTVRVRVWREGDWNQLSVTDSGIGIPADDLPYVFERFHRGTNVDDRRFAGMGLGLFICRGIVEQHGGRISVISRPGSGTTFFVTLPPAVPAATEETVGPVAARRGNGLGN